MAKTVTIAKVFPKEDRTAQNGAPYRKQDIVLAWKEKMDDGLLHDQSVMVSLLHDELVQFEQAGFVEGDEMTVDVTSQVFYSTRTGQPYNSIGLVIYCAG